MFNATNTKAQAIAQTLDKSVQGFLPILIIVQIIAAVLPELIKCFIPKDPAQAKDYVNKRYTAANHGDQYGGYNPVTVKRVMKLVRSQAATHGHHDMSDPAARDAAIKMLEDIRTSDPQSMQDVMTETYQSLKRN